MKHLLTLFLSMAMLNANAQKIDFNLSGKESSSTADGYTSWVVNRAQGSQSKSFTTSDGDEITIKVECVTGTGFEGNGCNNNWWKDGVNKYDKLICDGVYPVILDASNNYTPSTSAAMGLQFTISGLAAGEHSICAYHNNTDGTLTPGYPPLNVIVNGVTVLTGVEQTIRAQTQSASGMSYIKFTAEEGQDVVVQYITSPADGASYINNYAVVNGMIFDRPNPNTAAADPVPSDKDFHYDCDATSTATLTWTAAALATKHNVYIGTSSDNLTLLGTVTSPTIETETLSPIEQYYWRVDEVTSDGTVYEGDVWTFRPRHLAFPGAEGYGKYAIGGRGGSVYHVTSLDDDVDNPAPGTLRYGITKVTGPRTIVFDVSGYITLAGRLTCSDEYVTIAGQTAPGEGITLRQAPFGMASEGITRFIRSYRGYAGDENGPDEASQNRGLDGLGMAGNNNSIMDHCSIAWTTDEAFSSRNAQGLTLQRTLIAEALNCADHPNYSSGTNHGYAGTIGGGMYGIGVGSYHHNLLAHCEGRNWSLSGGLTSGAYAGAHDVFNNVVYNWGGRATDGGTHELNFVANYYKKGAATTQNYLLRHQFEGTGSGSQSAYVSGNIREELNGTKTQDAEGTTYRYELSGGQVLDWEPWATEPFFESLATVETAEAAYINVLSDVGCNQPFFNTHDARMVTETSNGTYTYVGSKTGKKGLIDREWDAEGFVEMKSEARAADFDTDQDGMPDWWETLTGTNPSVADNNTDSNNDGYTALEEYLNWLAEPHFEVALREAKDIALADYFAGYPSDAQYTIGTATTKAEIKNNNVLSISASDTDALLTVPVTATTGSVSYTRNFNIHYSATATGIQCIKNPEQVVTKTDNAIYNLAGQRVSASYRGIVVQNRTVCVHKH